MLEPRVYTVSQINRYIKNLLEDDFILSSFWVKGEISNFKRQSSGNLFFTLKDQGGVISCVMFKQDADMMPYTLENGISALVCGYVSLYEPSGKYQLYAQIIQPEGLGSLSLLYEKLKAKLESEGLFDTDFKREIRAFPVSIAVITSPTGAAIRDVINISKRRNPNVKITVVPVTVQGESSPGSIVSAIKLVNEWKKADIIILARGGGSAEDLWAFNNEAVARAIFASEIPVISGVGHETDFTISDFVSDLRAPTPSAAAELAVNDLYETRESLKLIKKRLLLAEKNILSTKTKELLRLTERGVLKRPLSLNIIREKIESNDMLKRRIIRLLDKGLKEKDARLDSLVLRLSGVSPLNVLSRGYSIVRDKDGKAVSNAEYVKEKDMLEIIFSKGRVIAKAEEVLKDG